MSIEHRTARAHEVPVAADEPAAIQERIQRRRERLLGGRGPGAGSGETARYMRDRPMLGGQPSAVARQQEAEQAALAIGEPDTVRDVVRQRRAAVAATTTVLADQIREYRLGWETGVRARLCWALAGAVTALAAQDVLRRRAHRHR